jgi:Uma2 family endonuclease
MANPAVRYALSVEEYLEREKTSLVKHEYHDGEIFAMAGGTPAHSLLATNAAGELRNALRGKPCRAYNSDLQVAISRRKYVYPDASVICGNLTFFEENGIAPNNPVVIVEVLSESTASYDRTGKFMRYCLMPSFREYVLVEQTFPFVEVRSRNEAGTWEIRTYGHLNDIIELKSIDVQLAMRNVYDGSDFGVESADEWFERYPVDGGR